MRITVDIDNDVLQAAKDRARQEKKTLGAVISDLARWALNAHRETETAPVPQAIHGLRGFPKRGGIVTNDLVDTLREDDVY